MAATTAAMFVVAPPPATAADVLTASPQRDRALHIETGASYVAADAFGGWGLSLRGGYLTNRYVMTGVGLETARLHAEGTVPVFGGAFSQTFQSTLAAAFVRVQLPTRFVTPYAELALGYTAIHGMAGFNYQCKEQGGASGGVALGAQANVLPSLGIGVRAGVRPPTSTTCAATGGPWTYESAALRSIALTAAYRW